MFEADWGIVWSFEGWIEQFTWNYVELIREFLLGHLIIPFRAWPCYVFLSPFLKKSFQIYKFLITINWLWDKDIKGKKFYWFVFNKLERFYEKAGHTICNRIFLITRFVKSSKEKQYLWCVRRTLRHSTLRIVFLAILMAWAFSGAWDAPYKTKLTRY